MVEQIPEKSEDFIEAECLKVARRGLGCSHLETVHIGRIEPSGSGPNWEVLAFEPELPPVARAEAMEKIAPMRQRFALPSMRMLQEVADVTLNKVKHFTIGFAVAGEEPAAKGSGVLVRHGDLFGILTCAHVIIECLDKLKAPVGLVRFNRELTEQFGILNINEVGRYAAGEKPWTDGDIAFIHLPPHLVGNIAKDCVFLDAEKNFTKPEPDAALGSPLIRVHSVFGLVEDFTGPTTRKNGRATTLLRGVLTSGALRDLNAMNATLECYQENLPDLPKSFGGTSGGGLWRVYLRKRQDGSLEALHHRLIGIASREDRGTPPRITCQGLGRIEAMLKIVRKELGVA
jgi:hypothetical protein